MDKTKQEYYHIMLSHDRCVPIMIGNRMAGFITYYITNDENEYINREDPWKYLPDNTNGHICYVDHVFTDKGDGNITIALIVWYTFKKYIKEQYPNVKIIRGNRFKHDKLHIHQVLLTKEGVDKNGLRNSYS